MSDADDIRYAKREARDAAMGEAITLAVAAMVLGMVGQLLLSFVIGVEGWGLFEGIAIGSAAGGVLTGSLQYGGLYREALNERRQLSEAAARRAREGDGEQG
jgi:peptidoglycan biosynthesis protein MviN/MurJ (putative lipid II flippase)